MRIRALVCRQCGAPLDLPLNVHTVRCEFCGYQFRPDTRIGPPSERPEPVEYAVAPMLAERKILNELDELDRGWESHRGGFRRRKSDGSYDVPAPKLCLAGASIAALAGLTIGGGLLWIAVADETALVVILGTTFLAAGLLYRARLGRAYQRSFAGYRMARRELLERLGRARARVCEESRA